MDRPLERKEIRWPYTNRPDGRIAVTIDNNVWDFLFNNNIDLASEFPAEQFALYIPREVEIEGEAIPNTESKKSIKKFIRDTILAATFLTTGAITLVVSRGQHLAWLVFFSIGGVCLCAAVI